MEKIREKYAAMNNVPLDSVPSIIQIKGKKELESLIGQDIQDFEHVGEGTVEDLIEFTRQNGNIEGAILIHYGGEDNDSYNGVIFSTDMDHTELSTKVKEAIPYNDTYKIKLKGTRKEIAEQLKEYIDLKKAKEFDKIQEQFERPLYAIGSPLFVSEDKENSEKRYSICFEASPKNKYGLHTRPIVAIVNKAKEYEKEISLIKDGREANSIMPMMALGIEKGHNVTVKVSGTDENSWKAALGIYVLFERKFGEE